MADDTNDQDYFGGLAQDLLGKTSADWPPYPGLASALTQGLVPISPINTAVFPPAGHLLGHVPTAAPAALGDMAAPAKAGSGGNTEAASQELGKEAIEDQRPNLGWSNVIRDQLPRGFSRDMFDNYVLGKGDYELGPDRFQDIVNTAASLGQSPKPVPVPGPNGEPLLRRTYNFSQSPDYALSLGSASLFYDQTGNPVGFYDNYNFDPAINKRSLLHEAETRAVHAIQPLLPAMAKPFELRYGLYARPQ